MRLFYLIWYVDVFKLFLFSIFIWYPSTPQSNPTRLIAVGRWWWWTRSLTPALQSSGFQKLASVSWSPAILDPRPVCAWPVASSLQRYSWALLLQWQDLAAAALLRVSFECILFSVECLKLMSSTKLTITKLQEVPYLTHTVYMHLCFSFMTAETIYRTLGGSAAVNVAACLPLCSLT